MTGTMRVFYSAIALAAGIVACGAAGAEDLILLEVSLGDVSLN